MKILTKILVVLAVAAAVPVSAATPTETLGSCLADNTSGKERKELARWVFVAMASHPELRDLAVATPAVREQTYQSVGVLVTRLLAENCAKETQAAVKAQGSQALRIAFESLGRVAMQELMSNPDVLAAIGGFEKFVDQKKIDSVLTPK
jgi:hypothetical protein